MPSFIHATRAWFADKVPKSSRTTTMDSTNTHPQSDRLDALLRTIADAERRTIITYLQTTTADIVSLDDLTTHLCTEMGQDRQPTRIRLHHNHLPELEQSGILAYHSASDTIEYHGDPELETLIEALQTTNLASPPRASNRED